MFWFSLGVFIGQNEEFVLLSHLAKTYRFGDIKIEFQSISSVVVGPGYLPCFGQYFSAFVANLFTHMYSYQLVFSTK